MSLPAVIIPQCMYQYTLKTMISTYSKKRGNGGMQGCWAKRLFRSLRKLTMATQPISVWEYIIQNDDIRKKCGNHKHIIVGF